MYKMNRQQQIRYESYTSDVTGMCTVHAVEMTPTALNIPLPQEAYCEIKVPKGTSPRDRSWYKRGIVPKYGRLNKHQNAAVKVFQEAIVLMSKIRNETDDNASLQYIDSVIETLSGNIIPNIARITP